MLLLLLFVVWRVMFAICCVLFVVCMFGVCCLVCDGLLCVVLLFVSFVWSVLFV